MPDSRALILVFLPGAACALAAVCESRPVPKELPAALRRIVDKDAAIGTVKPGDARPSGLILPSSVTLSGVDAPGHPALAALFQQGPLKVEASRLSSTRLTAEQAAHRIAQHVDEWEQESGPLAATARRWRQIDPDRQPQRIAVDLRRMVPDLGWWSRAKTFLEISARVEISPLRLRPFITALIWVDSENIPQAAVIREKDSGDLKTWFAVRTPPSDVAILKRLTVEGHSRFESYAVCRASP
jgi:hypothetical protein